MSKIYCAGPLFNSAERREMAEIAETLERKGHHTFLPQRDGLEFTRLRPELENQGAAHEEVELVLGRAIFALDVYHLLSWSEVLVANLNGRVPDEGTIVEATLAWHSRKALVFYKADSRSALDGSDNPMLTGLSDFQTVNEVSKLPDAVERQLAAGQEDKISGTLEFGQRIVSLRQQSRDVRTFCHTLLAEFRPSKGESNETV